MQDMETKLKILETILNNCDNFFIGDEATMVSELEKQYEYATPVRLNCILDLLEKLEYSVALCDKDEVEYIFYFNSIIDEIFSSLRTWSFCSIDEEAHYEFNNELEQMKEESCEDSDVKNFDSLVKDFVPPYFNMDVEKNKKLAYFIFDKDNFNSCMYSLNILYNPYLSKLIEDRLIKTEYLEYLTEPMLLYPYDMSSTYDSNGSTISWLTGWDEFYDCVPLENIYLNWRFIFVVIYIDICCSKYYMEPMQDYCDSNNCRYF